jgi:hypothetical protein
MELIPRIAHTAIMPTRDTHENSDPVGAILFPM